jgi:sugar/nucleoside kinase (ribokinase family)
VQDLTPTADRRFASAAGAHAASRRGCSDVMPTLAEVE